MTTQTTLTDRQRKQAEAHARQLIIEWTNDTIKRGIVWTPERISHLAHYWTGQADVPYAKRDEYAAILVKRLADNFDVDMAAYHAEMERLRQQFSDRMDELDKVYGRDTRPCLEGKPSVPYAKCPRCDKRADHLTPGHANVSYAGICPECYADLYPRRTDANGTVWTMTQGDACNWSPRVVMTKDGPQALLPTFDPPPVQKGEHITQTTMF
jgi:hypothetical protein